MTTAHLRLRRTVKWNVFASLVAQRSAFFISALVGLLPAPAGAAAGGAAPSVASPRPPESAYARWTNGPPSEPDFFPIGVWLQSPQNAARFKAAGINVYVALWRGPTAEQLRLLEQAGLRAVCRQNQAGLENKTNRTIIGWMHNDEPDNAQSLGEGKGYGPPQPPETIERDYQRMREIDSSRPIFLNLGQGVAWDNYIGRGVRRNHPEDYPRYLKGCDIASFDIYPAVHDAPEVAGKLEFVAQGVERLVKWSGPNQVIWNCIECTRISNPRVKPTPGQVRAEVWMSLIHGSRGLIYFTHQFQPSFREAALLDDPEMLAAVTEINGQIRELAPLLNSPAILNGATVETTPAESHISWMMKRTGNQLCLFAVNMRLQSAHARFRIRYAPADRQAEALGESRQVRIVKGELADDFKPYEVHLYRMVK